MRSIIKRKRKGMTMVETVIALFLMALAVIVMGRLTSTRIDETAYLNYQFDMRSADGFMYNIYQDFHECLDLSVAHDTTDGSTELAFDMGTAGTHVYEYRPTEQATYFNGAEQFSCASFLARGSTQSLYVSLKLHNGQRLEYEIYD